nr:fumarylacetoacetase [Quercus suber]
MSSPQLDKPPYTLANLPYGIISTIANPKPRCAIAIGDHAIDLSVYAKEGHFFSIESRDNVILQQVFHEPHLNAFAALPISTRLAVRWKIQQDLKEGKLSGSALVLLKDVTNAVPMRMGGFSDFYTSLEHCQNVGLSSPTTTRAQNTMRSTLLIDICQCSGEMSSASIAKNWWHAPSVYNSRVSSVLPTPHDVPRPKNVFYASPPDGEPTYGSTRKLDFELEMGFFVSKPVPYGDRLDIALARDHIFGFVMLNDWSARDHQLFEMKPLGPFHSKGLGTSISNWIVPMEALEPFSCAPNTVQDPAPFPHLTWPGTEDGALDIKLKIRLIRSGVEHVLGTSNLKYLYWTPYQQLTHHAASGCGMQTGDLIGTGTISGAGLDAKGEKAELGCLYEHERTKTRIMPQAHAGSAYQDGYLEDGDEIIMEGSCEDASGNVVLGFGECRGRIVPPR